MIRKTLIATLIMLPALAFAEPMAIVVSKNSSLSNLTQSEAQQLFSGQLRSLNGTAVQPVDLPSGDAKRHAFYQQLLGRSPDQMRSHWARLIFTGKARPPRETSGTAEMQSVVAGSDNLVGYIPKEAVNDRLKVLMVIE